VDYFNEVDKKMNKKAQLTIYGIIMVLVLIVIFSALHPVMDQQINILVENSTDQSVNLIANLYLPMLAIMILVTIVSLGSVLRGRGQE